MIINPSSIRQKIHASVAEQKRLHQWLLLTGPLLGYSLIERTTQCRKGGCRCTRGKPHGPFWYLSARLKGKTAYRYLRQADAESVAPLCRRYKNFQHSLMELRHEQAIILALYARLKKELLKAGERQWKKRIQHKRP